jgi:hypothetical protein
LSGKRIRLNFDVSVGDLIDEAGFTGVGETSDQEGTGIRVDSGHSCQMLSDFFEETEGGTESLDDLGHSTESGSLEHFASIHGVTVLHESDVILGDGVGEVTSSVDVAQGDFVMILVVDDVDKISIEGVDIVELGEAFEDFGVFFMDVFAGELDFSHVEGSDSVDGIAGMDNSGSFTLGFGENNVGKVIGIRDDLDLFEIIVHGEMRRMLKRMRQGY